MERRRLLLLLLLLRERVWVLRDVRIGFVAVGQ
jgi:hypothetical protein